MAEWVRVVLGLLSSRRDNYDKKAMVIVGHIHARVLDYETA